MLAWCQPLYALPYGRLPEVKTLARLTSKEPTYGKAHSEQVVSLLFPRSVRPNIVTLPLNVRSRSYLVRVFWAIATVFAVWDDIFRKSITQCNQHHVKVHARQTFRTKSVDKNGESIKRRKPRFHTFVLDWSFCLTPTTAWWCFQWTRKAFFSSNVSSFEWKSTRHKIFSGRQKFRSIFLSLI